MPVRGIDRPNGPARGGGGAGRTAASRRRICLGGLSRRLCPLGIGTHLLRCDAAAAYGAMATAFAVAFGRPLCVTDSYRGFGSQVTLYGQRPELAAVPGTSNHGWVLALDLCGGVDRFGTAEYWWMAGNAGRFGWIHPTWADPGNGREEPWHWEYAGG